MDETVIDKSCDIANNSQRKKKQMLMSMKE